MEVEMEDSSLISESVCVGGNLRAGACWEFCQDKSAPMWRAWSNILGTWDVSAFMETTQEKCIAQDQHGRRKKMHKNKKNWVLLSEFKIEKILNFRRPFFLFWARSVSTLAEVVGKGVWMLGTPSATASVWGDAHVKTWRSYPIFPTRWRCISRPQYRNFFFRKTGDPELQL